MQNIKEYGVDLGLLISGLFGAILMIGKGSANNLKTTIVSMLGGAASANYLTPVILDFLNFKSVNANYSVAFLLGFLGLKGVELVSEKLLGKKTSKNNKTK